jgi:hypothetical protein
MNPIVKAGMAVFLIAWTIVGIRILLKSRALFGPHPDDPSESAGARSFGISQVVAVWVGGFVLAIYFLSR